MNTGYSLIFLVFALLSFSCDDQQTERQRLAISQSNTSALAVDHILIWVDNPGEAKERLVSLGFTAVPDSLIEVHAGQGTAGKYFNFLNTYLELIFVYDDQELKENTEVNKELDFMVRANFRENGASPFGIALKVSDYDLEKVPFETIRYHQDWMEDNASIYAAKNSKSNLKEPSVFVVYPEIESQRFESADDLESIPDEYDFWRDTYQHPNGLQKITAIKITSPTLDMATNTISAVNEIEMLSVQPGPEHLMELFFDDNIQAKSFDLRPELPLIVHW